MDKIFEVNTQLNSKTVLDLNNLCMYVHLAIGTTMHGEWYKLEKRKKKKRRKTENWNDEAWTLFEVAPSKLSRSSEKGQKNTHTKNNK